MSLKNNLQRLTKEVEVLRKKLGLGPAGAFAETNEGIQQAQKEIKVLQENVDDLNDEFSGTRSILDGIAESLGKKVNFTKQAVKQYNKLGGIAQDISNQEQLGLRLSDKKLENKQSEAAAALKEIKVQAKALVNSEKIREILKDNSITQEELLGLNRDEGKSLMKKLNGIKTLSQEEKELITARAVGFTEEKKALGLIDDQIKRRKNANKSLGLAGALTKSLSSVGGEVAKAFNLDQITEDMQEFADANATANSRASKLAVLGEGIKSAFRNLGEGLSDPLVMFNFLLGAANKTSQRITDIQNQLGASYGEASRLNLEFQKTAALSMDNFITTEKLAKTFASLTKEIGMSAEILGSEALVTATKLTEELGMSGKEAANLVVMARLQGKETENVGQNVYDSVNALNNQNKSAIQAKDVLFDVSNVSSEISARFGENPKLIGEAAAQARLLGLSLEGVNKIAESLLNFESSIENEMKAELLTGKELNLEKARELALAGDLKGLGEEIGKQEAIRNAFADNNVIAQKALADALGLSVGELAEMNRQQELNNLTAEQFKNTYGEQQFEAAMAKSAQEKFNASLDKVKAILGGIGTALAPILDGLVFILDNPVAPYLISAFIVMKSMKALKLGSMFGDMAKGAKNTLGTIKDLTKASKFYKGGQFMPGGKRAPKGGAYGGGIGAKVKNLFKKTPDDIKKGADKTAGIKPKQGEDVKKFLKGLGTGLKSMSGADVLFGALNLIPTALGLTAMLPAIPTLLFLGKVSLKKLSSNLISLSTGLQAMAPTFVGSAALAAFAIAGALAIPSLIFLGGVALIGEAAAVGLGALGGGLATLGGIAATGLPFLAIALIAALGVAMIPFGYALGLAAPAIEAFGTVILSVFQGIGVVITAVADGFVKMFNVITSENIAGLLLLGPALLGISVGLAAVGAMGLLAMPTLLALTALGTVAGGLVSIFGGESESTTPTDDPMVEKLNEVNKNILKLISVVEKGGDVIMDGAIVGKSISMASSRIG